VARILPDGTWIADSIRKSGNSQRLLTYDGSLQEVDGAQWQIGGLTIPFETSEHRILLDGIVRVTFGPRWRQPGKAGSVRTCPSKPTSPNPARRWEGQASARSSEPVPRGAGGLTLKRPRSRC
jgi:hypothetical protein